MAGTSDSFIIPDCFIHLNICYSLFIDNSDQFLLSFTNNEAGERGHVLYGGWLNDCRRLFKILAECGTMKNKESPIEIVKNISILIPHDDEILYTFSSKPNSLCIYNKSSNDHCGLPVAISVSPGEMFNVSLLTIDQYSNSIRMECK